MKTKIIATLNWRYSYKKIKNIIDEGVSISRINLKYTPLKEYDKFSEKLRKAGVKIMLDFKDRSKLHAIKEKDFDYLGISFAENPKEIEDMKKKFPRKKIISKIETKKGVDNVNKLIKVSHGIMIARGDLGRNIPIEKVPMIQKQITKKCNRKNKFSITATEIMPSMVTRVRPSRAEVSDIFNAIIEGSDALLLAEETVIGKHPELVVKELRKIIKESEKYLK